VIHEETVDTPLEGIPWCFGGSNADVSGDTRGILVNWTRAQGAGAAVPHSRTAAGPLGGGLPDRPTPETLFAVVQHRELAGGDPGIRFAQPDLEPTAVGRPRRARYEPFSMPNSGQKLA